MSLLLLLAVVAVDTILVAASLIVGRECVNTAHTIRAQLVVFWRLGNITLFTNKEMNDVATSI